MVLHGYVCTLTEWLSEPVIYYLLFPNRSLIKLVVKHWHRLPREAVAAPSLAVFKARLEGALSNLV